MTELTGKRVLVVEDEMIIALDIEQILEDAGCIVIGPFGRVAKALAVVDDGLIDVALLDVSVADEMVFPVAYALEQREIPFLFLSGYGSLALPADRPDWEACSKPVRPEELLDTLARKVSINIETP